MKIEIFSQPNHLSNNRRSLWRCVSPFNFNERTFHAPMGLAYFALICLDVETEDECNLICERINALCQWTIARWNTIFFAIQIPHLVHISISVPLTDFIKMSSSSNTNAGRPTDNCSTRVGPHLLRHGRSVRLNSRRVKLNYQFSLRLANSLDFCWHHFHPHIAHHLNDNQQIWTFYVGQQRANDFADYLHLY